MTKALISAELVGGQVLEMSTRLPNSVNLKGEITEDFSVVAGMLAVGIDSSLLTVAGDNEMRISHDKSGDGLLKIVFKRLGPDYDFGPTPVVWSSKVWKSLEKSYLIPNKLTLWDAIEMAPSELRWYGEALLAYKAIPIYPIEPLFRVYHYDWQYFTSKKMGETNSTLLVNYLGILKQSNWDYERDSGKQAKRKSFLSKVVRVLKRIAARFR
jgi:hypothetical protein